MWHLIYVPVVFIIGYLFCAVLTQGKINDLYETIRELEAKNNDGRN